MPNLPRLVEIVAKFSICERKVIDLIYYFFVILFLFFYFVGPLKPHGCKLPVSLVFSCVNESEQIFLYRNII